MNKTETIVLILILVVAFAGVWFLFKGPGMATLSIQPQAYQTAIRSEGYTEQVGDVLISVPPSMPAAQPSGNLCVCKNTATGQVQSRPAGAGESIYSCRSSCVSQGLQFVALQQPAASTTITAGPATGIKSWYSCKCEVGGGTDICSNSEAAALRSCATYCQTEHKTGARSATAYSPSKSC